MQIANLVSSLNFITLINFDASKDLDNEPIA